MYVSSLAVVVRVLYWRRSFRCRPTLSPVRFSLGWYICTVDISQHQHLAPGFSYDFSSCRSFVLPLVTLRPVIHTHKVGLKSYKKTLFGANHFIKKSNIPSCNDQCFLYSGPLTLNPFVPLNHWQQTGSFFVLHPVVALSPLCFYLRRDTQEDPIPQFYLSKTRHDRRPFNIWKSRFGLTSVCGDETREREGGEIKWKGR